MNNQENIFIGSGWYKCTDGGFQFINGILELSDIPKEHIIVGEDGKKRLKITIGENSKKKTENSPTHYIKVNNYTKED